MNAHERYMIRHKQREFFNYVKEEERKPKSQRDAKKIAEAKQKNRVFLKWLDEPETKKSVKR